MSKSTHARGAVSSAAAPQDPRTPWQFRDGGAKASHDRYATAIGPERAAHHSLDDWTDDDGREARKLRDAQAEAHRAERVRSATVPDVYQVADKVLAPLMEETTTIPRRLRAEIDEGLAARGTRPTRRAKLQEAARLLAGAKAADDLELALAITLRAALLWAPEGGWRAHSPRPRGDGFPSLRALLTAAFAEVALGAGPIPMEVAQNRARTRSIAGEVFVSASHSGSSRAKNAAAVDRRADAQTIIARCRVAPAILAIMYERVVLGRHKEPDDLTIGLRAHAAKMHGIMLPAKPGKDAEPSEIAEWFQAAGIALHGALTEGDAERYVLTADRVLVACYEEAEHALRKAIGLERRKRKPSTRVQGRSEARS